MRSSVKSKATLLPKVFKEGTDYAFNRLGNGEAKIALLNPDKFRQFKFVVVLE